MKTSVVQLGARRVRLTPPTGVALVELARLLPQAAVADRPTLITQVARSHALNPLRLTQLFHAAIGISADEVREVPQQWPPALQPFAA